MTQPSTNPPALETLVSLCKRRGFIFQTSELYGGAGAVYDYGPLGVELKRNIKEAWWRSNVWARDDMVGLDSAIILHPQVWMASGHAEGFTDPLVECKNCQQRFREDRVDSVTCPECDGALTEPRLFNLMLKTFLGPVEDSAHLAWLRPETAQGIFTNFQNVLVSSRYKLPFGIAQIGKAFRNEITTGNFIFRTREFEQMEIEYFVSPETDEQWYRHWIENRLAWYHGLGLSPHKLRLRTHTEDELAHYAKACTDIEYHFPWGWAELEGIANRTDVDLRRHQTHSGRDLSYFDTNSEERYLPYVIEPSGGVDRAILALLADSYCEEEVPTASGKNETRTILRLNPVLAPIKIAILPLSRNTELVARARDIYQAIRPHFSTQYDDAQSIGRRYRRQDEIGTPLCITVDFQTIEDDNAVTIRYRDSMSQERIPIPTLLSVIRERLDL